MEDDHYIEWICLVSSETEEYKYFNSSDACTCEFKKVRDGVLYSYCNKLDL